MERVIYNSCAMPVTPRQRTMGQAGRYEGEPDARKRARPVRWRGKALSSPDGMLIPLSFKWNRACAYCSAKNVPLQVEHIKAKANGGTNRVSNLCLACKPCNIKKGTQDIQDFLKHEPDMLKRILAQAKASLKDASAVNSTRWALYERLKATGLLVECGTGGMTKFHRITQGLDKAHWIDAACVGKSTPDVLLVDRVRPLLIKATGHGSRQMCLMDKYGFPRTKAKMRQKSYMGFKTGDMVKAIVPSGKYQGTHKGRIAIRFRPSFHLNSFNVHPNCLTVVHRQDGYSYTKGESHFPPHAFRPRGECDDTYGCARESC